MPAARATSAIDFFAVRAAPVASVEQNNWDDKAVMRRRALGGDLVATFVVMRPSRMSASHAATRTNVSDGEVVGCVCLVVARLRPWVGVWGGSLVTSLEIAGCAKERMTPRGTSGVWRCPLHSPTTYRLQHHGAAGLASSECCWAFGAMSHYKSMC